MRLDFPSTVGASLKLHPLSGASITFVVAVGIALLGAGLRLYCLDCHGLWYDEIASVEVAQRGVPAIFNDRFGWMLVQPPLHYLLTGAGLLFADPVETSAWVRLPSAIAGVLLIPVVYGLGKELFGRATGLLLMLLAALSATLIDYAQDVRPYSVLTLLTASSIYALLRAERTGLAAWWVAFAFLTILNILNAYIALTLVLLALAPYLAWALWRLWKAPPEKSTRSLVWPLLSVGAVLLVSILSVPGATAVPRTPPDWSLFSPLSPVLYATGLLKFLTRSGLPQTIETVVQLLTLLLFMVGAFGAVKVGRERSALLCGLLVLVPSLLLAVLSTSNTINLRYGLFMWPFFLATAAHGIVYLASMGRQLRASYVGGLLGGAAASLALLLVAASTYGAFYVNSADGQEELSSGGNLREVARYLERVAGPDDVALLADDPALAYATLGFYWRGSPPIAIYDARDPRLYKERPQGDVFWVVASLEDRLLDRIAQSEQSWLSVAHFSGAVVLRENVAGRDPASLVEAMSERMEAIAPDFPPVLTLRGSALQGKGDDEGAASAYHKAWKLFTVGDEYFNTALGFEARGDMERAWREALISKLIWPANPELHTWMARQLRAEGRLEEAQVAERIAARLDAAGR